MMILFNYLKASGLQNCLNVLEKNCCKWKLKVDVQKSKLLVFKSNGKSFIDEFTFIGNLLQTCVKI